jgi:hypothetical protein
MVDICSYCAASLQRLYARKRRVFTCGGSLIADGSRDPRIRRMEGWQALESCRGAHMLMLGGH